MDTNQTEQKLNQCCNRNPKQRLTTVSFREFIVVCDECGKRTSWCPSENAATTMWNEKINPLSSPENNPVPDLVSGI